MATGLLLRRRRSPRRVGRNDRRRRTGACPAIGELIARGAKVKQVGNPGHEPEPQYRPSTALDEFVRMRDMTCRGPGCDRPAVFGDIDHTVAYPGGPTHPGNLKCYCRKHRLLTTF